MSSHGYAGAVPRPAPTWLLCIALASMPGCEAAESAATSTENLITGGGTQSAVSAPAATEAGPISRSEECRRLAVPDVAGDPTDATFRALAACREAAAHTSDGDIFAALGRTAFKAKLPDEARAAFRKGMDANNCESMFYLAEAAWFGDENAEEGQRLYESAAACGDQRAQRAIFSAKHFARSAYPAWIEALDRGDVATLNQGPRPPAAMYLTGFWLQLHEMFLGKDMKPCYAATLAAGGRTLLALKAAQKGDARNLFEGFVFERALPFVFIALFPDQGTTALDEYRDAAQRGGAADANRLIETAGVQCGDLLPYRMVQTIVAFADAPKPLTTTVDELSKEHGSLQAVRDTLLAAGR